MPRVSEATSSRIGDMVMEDHNLHSRPFIEFREHLGSQFDFDITETDIEGGDYGE